MAQMELSPIFVFLGPGTKGEFVKPAFRLGPVQILFWAGSNLSLFQGSVGPTTSPEDKRTPVGTNPENLL